MTTPKVTGPVELALYRGQSLSAGPNPGSDTAPDGRTWHRVFGGTDDIHWLRGLNYANGNAVAQICAPLANGYGPVGAEPVSRPMSVTSWITEGAVAVHGLMREGLIDGHVSHQFHDIGGISVTVIGDPAGTPYANAERWLTEAMRAYDQADVAVPRVVYNQGEADLSQPRGWWAPRFATTWAGMVEQIQRITGVTETPALYLHQTGGYGNKTSDYWPVLDQLDAVRDLGGVLIGPNWAHLVDNYDDRMVHMSITGHIEMSEMAVWAIAETEAGRDWSLLPGSATRTGDTITIPVSIRDDEALTTLPGKYASYGGDPANLGLEVTGGGSIVAASVSGGNIVLQVAGEVSTVRHAFQRTGIDYGDLLDADGCGYVSHRSLICTTLTKSVEWGGQAFTLRRWVPSFEVGVTAAGIEGWRAPLLGSSILGLNGHSLTTAWSYTDAWLAIIRNSLFDPDDHYTTHLLRADIPGSPLHYRWQHQARDENNNPVFDENGDPVMVKPLFSTPESVGVLDAFITTEGGPYARIDVPADRDQLLSTLRFGLLFYDNVLTHGRLGLETECLWHTMNAWPDGNPVEGWNNATFHDMMIEYERTSHYVVGYWQWRLRQMHPGLPEGWRIPILPLHRLWIRLINDFAAGAVPGFDDIRELFSDDIHPAGMGAYASAVMGAAMLYGVDPRDLETYTAGRLYDPIAIENIGKWPVPATAPAGFFPYICDVVMDALRAYEPAGMGGTDRGEATWYDPADGDPLDGDGPDPEPGELPADVAITMTAEGYAGPVLTGPQLTVEGNILVLSGVYDDVRIGDLTLSEYHYVCAIRLPAGSTNVALNIVKTADGQWSTPYYKAVLNYWPVPAANTLALAPATGDEIYASSGGVSTDGGWMILSGTVTPTALTNYSPLTGAPTTVAIEGPAQTSKVILFGLEGDFPRIEVAGFALLPRTPTETEIADMRAWAQGRIPE